MKVNSYEKFGAVVIEIKDKLIGGPESQEFSDLVNKSISEKKTHIILDLSKVKFVNSSGLGIMIRNFTSVTNAGGRLVLAAINEKMRGLLSITKLNKVFDVYQTLDEAGKSFQ